MKFLHTADLHIGKKIFELSLIEDQKYILNQIIEIASKEQVDAILIAGDVYDRALPSTEAVTLLDDFLTTLIQKKIPVIMISGNHDSPERVAFAEQILEKQGLYIAGTYTEPIKTVTLEDEYGPIVFVCMPFVKPGVVGCQTSAQAVEKMLAATPMPLGLNVRKVLLTHYFVTGEGGEVPELSDSESDINVGGLDNVPVGLFQSFDYVALGHIHKPQRVGDSNAYYSGSTCKYSFSEALKPKSVNIVELGAKGEITVNKRELTPLHEMRCIKGKLQDLIGKETLASLEQTAINDYIQATLTDTEELIDPIGTLRSVYPNVLHIIIEKNVREHTGEYQGIAPMEKKSTTELFTEFYEMLKGEKMDDKRLEVVQEIADDAEKMTAK